MSVSKLAAYRIGTALFRIPRTRTLTLTTPSPFLFKPIPLPFMPLHRRASSSSAAAEEETVSAVDQNHHPWPEWISFVDHLITKGYISKPSSSSGDGVYANINLLKDAFLSFARDPYDLDKLLPSEDIQAVVEGGCPNLLCKAVNSTKRLRAHLRLDDGDARLLFFLEVFMFHSYWLHLLVIFNKINASKVLAEMKNTLYYWNTLTHHPLCPEVPEYLKMASIQLEKSSLMLNFILANFPSYIPFFIPFLPPLVLCFGVALFVLFELYILKDGKFRDGSIPKDSGPESEKQAF